MKPTTYPSRRSRDLFRAIRRLDARRQRDASRGRYLAAMRAIHGDDYVLNGYDRYKADRLAVPGAEKAWARQMRMFLRVVSGERAT